MDEKHILLLQHMRAESTTLVPTPTPLSPYGYSYRDAQPILETEIGQEISELNRLSELGLLERESIDKIHLCPYCQHFALNFREVCPQCESHFITEVDMLHHYACGYVSFEQEFQKDDKLICPKCRKSIRHLGVDYERSATTFRCGACAYIFPEPETGCLSLACSQSFLIDRAILQPIFSYRLSPRGNEAAARGGVDQLDPMESGVAGSSGFQFFETELTREIDRASIHNRPFCLLLLQPKDIDVYENLMGEDATDFLFQSLLDQITILIRKSDLVTIYEQRFLAILLPETTQEDSIYMAKGLEAQLNAYCEKKLGSEMTFWVGLLEFMNGIDSSEDMLQEAANRLDAAKEETPQTTVSP